MSYSADTTPIALLLRRLEAFGDFAEAERRAILSLPVNVVPLERRTNVIREGETPTKCAIVIDGWLCRYKLLPDGVRQILAVHIAGDFPDLISLHMRKMDHSLMAVNDAVVGLVSHRHLVELCAGFPAIAAALWKETMIDASVLRERIVGLGRRSAEQRVGHFFCEMYLRLRAMGLAKEHQFPLPLTQIDLSDIFSLSTVHVCRTLRHLRAEGLVSITKRMTTIHNWEGLVKISAFDPTYLLLRTE